MWWYPNDTNIYLKKWWYLPDAPLFLLEKKLVIFMLVSFIFFLVQERLIKIIKLSDFFITVQAITESRMDESSYYIHYAIIAWWNHSTKSLKVVSATFVLVYFLSLNESTCQNVFYFTSKVLSVLEKIKC